MPLFRFLVRKSDSFEAWKVSMLFVVESCSDANVLVEVDVLRHGRRCTFGDRLQMSNYWLVCCPHYILFVFGLVYERARPVVRTIVFEVMCWVCAILSPSCNELRQHDACPNVA